jgi:nucleoid-associated protein YgaU
MKYPVAFYTVIAAVAASALGGTMYLRQPQLVATPVVAKAVEPEKPVAVPKVEAAPIKEAAIELAPQPVTKPKVEEPKTEVAVLQQPETATQPEKPAVAETPATVEKPAASAAVAATELPAFDTVRVEKSGEALIAGRAEADSDVTVKWNGNVVGTTKANADGSFVLVPAKPLATGIGAMVIEMSKNGQVTTSEGSVIVAVNANAPSMVAKVDPVAPTEVLQSGAEKEPRDVQLTAVDYDAKGNIVFSGQATPGSIVRFYVDNATAGEGVANADGKWSFQGSSAITPGTHTLRADAVDANGKVLSRIEMPFLREEPAKVAEAQIATATPEAAPPVTRSTVVEKQVTTPPAAEAPIVESPAAPQSTAAPETQVVVATPPVAAPVPEEPRKLVIQPGNNLWKLSREVYGKGRMYTVIFKANRDQVKNPNRIYPGQILTAPKMN